MNQQQVITTFDSVLKEEAVNEYSVVLSSMDIPYSLKRYPDGWKIDIQEEYQNAALNQINLYESENREKIRDHDLIIKKRPFPFLVPILFYSFYMIVFRTEEDYYWFEVGTASSFRILQGEWWRAITALTLHLDITHILSNILFGTIAASALIRRIGSGMTWFFILLSGIAGNFLNALIQGPAHRSVGASTAIFGAFGILTTLQLFGKNANKRWKAWVYLASAFAILGFLGTAGENTDTAAHLLGLVAGSLIGFAFVSPLTYWNIPEKIFNWILTFISLAIIVLSWVKAFNII